MATGMGKAEPPVKATATETAKGMAQEMAKVMGKEKDHGSE